jgi:hypothetical protein
MPLVGLLETGSRHFRELRNWTFAPLGLVLVVVLLGAGVITMLATGGGPSPEELIRNYFASNSGGGATAEQARRIRVSNCAATTGTARGEIIYKCNVVFADQGYTGCFAWNSKRVVAGSRELGSSHGCTPLHWSRAVGSLMAP